MSDAKTVEENLKLITDALAGSNQDQREIAFLGLQTIAIMVKKNQDYGSSVFNIGALSPDITPEQGIRVRLGDKLSRINNLVAQPDAQRVSESITDTGHDASAYLLLWVISRMRAGKVEVCGQTPICLEMNSNEPKVNWDALIQSKHLTDDEEAEYIEGDKKRVR